MCLGPSVRATTFVCAPPLRERITQSSMSSFVVVSLPKMDSTVGIAWVREMIALFQAIGGSEVFRRVCQEIPSISLSEFEKRSQEGKLWVKKRPIDLGAWSCSFLFQLLWQFAEQLQHPVRDSLRLLETKFATLLSDTTFSDTAVCVQGQLIKYALADARLTGPAVDQVLRTSRHEFMNFIRTWQQLERRFLKIVCTEYPDEPDLPPPAVCASYVIQLAAVFI